MSAITRLAEFVASADIPNDARAVARDAFQDTVGVMLQQIIEKQTQVENSLRNTSGSNSSSKFLLSLYYF